MKALLVTTVAMFGFASAFAQEAPKDGGLSEWSRPLRQTFDGSQCISTAAISYDKVIQRMDDIREMWLNRDHSADFYRQSVNAVIVNILPHKLGEVMVYAVYNLQHSSSLDRCDFNILVEKPDNFGHSDFIPIVSWQMTNEIARKIDWDHFDNKNLPNIALNWKYSNEAKELVSAQAEQATPEPQAQSGEECHKTLKFHGYLSRAQFQCGFQRYSEALLSAARQCNAEVGDNAAVRNDLAVGMQVFDFEEKQRGHPRECQYILQHFNDLVQK
jgi:hypothetical protein